MAAATPTPATATGLVHDEPDDGVLTHRQIVTILIGLMMGMFLAALDQTIVATSIRTIADDLHGLSAQAWVTTAYLITSTIVTPLYGKLSDMYGRKQFFVLAITLHNFPEGMAVGVGAALGGPGGLTVAIGIGLQNVPEGLVVAAALLDKGFPRRTALLVAVASGAVEPVGALEVLPESHEGGHARAATWTAMAGFVLNMVLDAALT